MGTKSTFIERFKMMVAPKYRPFVYIAAGAVVLFIFAGIVQNL